MNSKRFFTAVVALGTAAVPACGGRLHVGDKDAPKAGTGGSAGSTAGSAGKSTAGSSGGGSAGASNQAGSSNIAGAGGLAESKGGTAGTSAGTSSTGGASAFAGAGGATAGTGGTTAGAGGATGGTNGEAMGGVPNWLEDVDPVEPVGGSSEECPEGPHLMGASCETKGIICGYAFIVDDHPAYQECACARSSGDALAWNCYDEQSSPDARNCPEEMPGADVDCFGFFGSLCPYPPRMSCLCKEEVGTWECEGPGTTPPPSYLDPPTAPSSERLISALDADEREAWCTWYAAAMVGGPGYPLPSDAPVETDGYARNVGCNFGTPQLPCYAALPVVSVAQCAANLELSNCDAAVSALTTCVVGVKWDCSPASDGCYDFFAASGDCSGTIATKLDDDTPPMAGGCGIRVE